MKRILTIFVAQALVMSSAMAVFGQTGRIGNRKERQQQRIARGVQSGELTAKEAAKLEKDEAQLNAKIRKNRQDGGGLSGKERLKIENEQNKESVKIAKEKHDKQRRN